MVLLLTGGFCFAPHVLRKDTAHLPPNAEGRGVSRIRPGRWSQGTYSTEVLDTCIHRSNTNSLLYGMTVEIECQSTCVRELTVATCVVL